MSERHGARSGPGGTHAPAAATDSELGVRGILGFGVGLAVLIAVSLGLVWLLSAHLKASSAAGDPEPSPLAEANAHRLPPEPRLQTTPVLEMRALRAKEEAALGGYGWTDRTAGVARIPIERAIDILARTGLPEPPHPATPAAGAGTPGTPGTPSTDAAAQGSGAGAAPGSVRPASRPGGKNSGGQGSHGTAPGGNGARGR